MVSIAFPFQKTLKGLDQLINQLELNLGRQHTPFSLPQNKENPNNNNKQEESKVQEKSKIQEPIKKETKTKEKPKDEPLNKEELLKLFSFLDIRIGKITDCWKVKNTHKKSLNFSIKISIQIQRNSIVRKSTLASK